ncbi:MAG: DUF4118 domain-containing protein [Spirochaetota bacterium]
MAEKLSRSLVSYGVPLASVAFATLIYTMIVPHIPDTTIVLTYVLIVLLCSLFWGMGSGLTASLAGALCFNYFFIQPVGTFLIANPQDIAAFSFFVIAAVIVSALSSAIQKHTDEISRKRSEVERLNRLATVLLQVPDTPKGTVAIADSIVAIFSFEYCGVHVPDRKGMWKHVSLSSKFPHNVTLPDSGKFQKVTLDTLIDENERQVEYVKLRTPKGTIGLFAYHADGVSENVVEAIASMVALTLQRSRKA